MDGKRIEVAEMENIIDAAHVLCWSSEFAPPIIPLDCMILCTNPVTTLQYTNSDPDLCTTKQEDWKKWDPNFNDTPYVESNGNFTSGFIAAVTIMLSIIIAVAIF